MTGPGTLLLAWMPSTCGRNPERVRRLAAEQAIAAMNRISGANRLGAAGGGQEESSICR